MLADSESPGISPNNIRSPRDMQNEEPIYFGSHESTANLSPDGSILVHQSKLAWDLGCYNATSWGVSRIF